MPRLVVFFISIFMPLGVVVADASGDLLVGSQFPPALLHGALHPERASVVAKAEFTLDTTVAWSNTFVRRRGDYLLDLETRVLRVRGGYGIAPGVEISGSLPLIWRGGGVLDSVIKEWDGALGYTNTRRRVDDDSYAFEGETRDGDRFALMRNGFGVAPPTVAVKYEGFRSSDVVWSLLGQFTLPVATEEFGTPGVDSTAGVLGSLTLGSSAVHWGLAGTVLGDDEYRGLPFERYRGEGFVGGEYFLTELLTLKAGLLGSSAVVRDVARFVDTSLYLDIGFGYEIVPGWNAGIVVRENPLHPDVTTDFTLLFTLGWIDD